MREIKLQVFFYRKVVKLEKKHNPVYRGMRKIINCTAEMKGKGQH